MESGRIWALALTLGLVALTVVTLVFAKNLLLPFAVAVMIWYLLNALANWISRLTFGHWHMPRWFGLLLAVLLVFGILTGLAELVVKNVSQVSTAAPTYQDNLQRLFGQVSDMIGISQLPNLGDLVKQLDIAGSIRAVAGSLTGLAGKAGIILIYVVFLLLEQRTFETKLDALFPDPTKRRRVRDILGHIQRDIETYVAIKTLLSIATGAVSYGVLLAVGVDYAEFWALLIFLLNYIPTIGSLLATIFPALLALVQFPTMTPAVVVVVSISVVQFVIGNLLEPRLMGRSLNLSGLVVLISLALWGSLWGVVGMFLCVPITVVLMIVFSNFQATRPVAILLSADGHIRASVEEPDA